MSQQSSGLTALLGASVRRLRQERGLTQAELAHAVGLGPVQISRIERGVQEPRFATIERLAEALDTDAALFWTGPAGKVGTTPMPERRPGAHEPKPLYVAMGDRRLNRRLSALNRRLAGLEPELAAAVIEACMALIRELSRRKVSSGAARPPESD